MGGGDLGTRFEVEVDHQTRESNISVIEGLVDLHLGSRGAERTIRRLEAGFPGLVNAFGKIVEISNGVGASVAEVRDSEILAHWKLDELGADGELFDSSVQQLNRALRADLPRRGLIRYRCQDGLHFDSISRRVDGWSSGRWYHVAVTADGGVARLYRDGKMIASGSAGSKIGTPVSNPSLVKGASHAYIGWLADERQTEDSAHQWFEGAIDDVQFHSGALGQEAIRLLFGLWGKPKFSRLRSALLR